MADNDRIWYSRPFMCDLQFLSLLNWPRVCLSLLKHGSFRRLGKSSNIDWLGNEQKNLLQPVGRGPWERKDAGNWEWWEQEGCSKTEFASSACLLFLPVLFCMAGVSSFLLDSQFFYSIVPWVQLCSVNVCWISQIL